MESSATQQALEKTINPLAPLAPLAPVAPVALSTPQRPMQKAASEALPGAEKKVVGYGMPCSHCSAYYPADMRVCPVC